MSRNDEVRTNQNLPFDADEVVHLAPEAQRAYDAVVRPNAIVPIARYFMDNWLPLLGTSRSWVTLAFRQVAFVSRSGDHEVPVRTTLRKLSRWCGLSHVRVHQLLNDPDYLTWFVRNPQGDLAERSAPRSAPTTYMVRSDIPLTPKDQARLTLWLHERAPSDDTDWIHSIEGAIEARELELPEDLPLPDISLTVQQIVYAQRGDDTPLPPSLDEACTELHSRWIQPDRVTLATHYFIVRWLPDLSAGLGWLILRLRSRTYLQKESQVGQVWITGGWKGLAASIGVSRKSLSRWVNSDIANLFVKRREDTQDPANKRNILLYVRMSEPIHPDDEEEYHSLLKRQDLTSPIPLDRQELTSPSTAEGQNLTAGGEQSTKPSRNLTAPGQELPDAQQNLTSDEPKLNTIGTILNALSTSKFTSKFVFKDSVQPHPLQTIPEPNSRVGKQSTWNLDEILNSTGVGRSQREKLLNASVVKKQAFIGWILFALTVPKIENPVLFALKKVKKDDPPKVYVQLAQGSPEDTVNLLLGKVENVSNNLEKAVVELRKGRAHQKLLELGMAPLPITSMDENIPEGKLEGREGKGKRARTSDQSPRDQETIGLNVWNAAKSQLRLELSKAIFDTWVKDIELIEFGDDALVLGAANEYASEWLNDRMRSKIERIITGIVGREILVHFMVHDDVEG